jgi:hypothetical protein
MRGTISVPNGLARLADSSKFARKGTTVAVTVEFAVGTWRIADNFKGKGQAGLIEEVGVPHPRVG